MCVRRSGREHSTFSSVCVCVCVCGDGPWLTHMAAICEVSAVELGREKVLSEKDSNRTREREGRERENTWREGSQKCPVQLAGMYLLCFIDGLMFCKTRGTTVVILWAAMHFSFGRFEAKRRVTSGGKKV